MEYAYIRRKRRVKAVVDEDCLYKVNKAQYEYLQEHEGMTPSEALEDLKSNGGRGDIYNIEDSTEVVEVIQEMEGSTHEVNYG